MKPEGSLPHS